jgi:DDE family transposase
VHADLDSLVQQLYGTITGLLGPRRRVGRPPKLSDAALVSLAVAQVLLGARSERHWLRMVARRLGHLFPYIPQQSGYNKRLRAAAEQIALVLRMLAVTTPTTHGPLRLLDATPIPCGTSRETVKRSALAGLASYGYCAAHARWYWGLKLYLLTAPDGMPVNWCLATPKLGERAVAVELLEDTPRPLLAGTTIIGDKGFAGVEFERQVTELGAVFVRPDRRDEPARHGDLGAIRQRIESVIDTLKGQLSLEQHGGRTVAGVWVRIAQRLLALAAVLWFNQQLGRPGRHLTAYDH